MKVLIVEDDLVIADMYSEMIDASGLYTVCCIARTIKEAVQCAKKHDPDLALIDIRLTRGELGTDIPPLLDPRVGILYSTGNAERLQLEGIRGHGCLTKPYSNNDLVLGLDVISEMITKGKLSLPLPRNFLMLPEGTQRLAA